jgi:hypothetical protein
MIYIQHRTNSIKDLILTDEKYGVEIDLRNHGKDLIVVHDPFDDQEINFEQWLSEFKHKFLIINVKEEGLEPKIFELLSNFHIKNYFILDESIPYILKYSRMGVPNFAIRVSEFEVCNTALEISKNLKGMNLNIDWIWADSFTGKPLDVDAIWSLKEAGFKICQVSPELHHVENPDIWIDLINNFHDQINSNKKYTYIPDMVCTKRPDLWENFMKTRPSISK